MKLRYKIFIFVLILLTFYFLFIGGVFIYENIKISKITQQINTFIKEKKYEDAVDLYKKIIKLNPINSTYLENAYVGLGRIFFDKHEYDKAIEYFYKALGVNPNSINAIINLGSIFLAQKNYDKALEQFHKVLEIDANSAEGYSWLGYTHYLKALSFSDWQKESNSIKKNLKKAEKYLSKSIELDPFDANTYILLGQVYKTEEDYNKALISFQKAIKYSHSLSSNHVAQIYYEIANCYHFLAMNTNDVNFYRKAKEFLEKAKSLTSDISLIAKINNELQGINSFLGYLEEKEKKQKQNVIISKKEKKLPSSNVDFQQEYTFQKEKLIVDYNVIKEITPVMWDYFTKFPISPMGKSTKDIEEDITKFLSSKLSIDAKYIEFNMPDPLLFGGGLFQFGFKNNSSKWRNIRLEIRLGEWAYPVIKKIKLKPYVVKMFSITPLMTEKAKDNREITPIPYYIKIKDVDNGKIIREETGEIFLGAKGDAILSLLPATGKGNLPFSGKVRSAQSSFDVDFRNALLASWVTPNHPWIDRILSIAKEKIPSRTLNGYQGNVYSQMKAIFYALRENIGISYVSTTLSMLGYSESESRNIFQRIKFPAESIETRMANCIDGAVLYASLFEAIGLESVIVLVPGHAFVGVKTSPGSDKYYFLETTLTGKGYGLEENLNRLAKWLLTGENDFDTAVRTAGEEFRYWNSKNKAIVIDIKSCREVGIYPFE